VSRHSHWWERPDQHGRIHPRCVWGRGWTRTPAGLFIKRDFASVLPRPTIAPLLCLSSSKVLSRQDRAIVLCEQCEVIHGRARWLDL